MRAGLAIALGFFVKVYGGLIVLALLYPSRVGRLTVAGPSRSVLPSLRVAVAARTYRSWGRCWPTIRRAECPR
jgi:hypothetical protein